MEDKAFTIHFDFAFTDSKNLRLSISNIYKEEKYNQFSIQVPLTLPKDKWTVVCLDTEGYLNRYRHAKENEKHFLRSLTVCANIYVSRIATSDKVFDYESLPRDLNYKLNKGESWEDKYVWLEPIPCEHSTELAATEKPHKENRKEKVIPKTIIKTGKHKVETKTLPIKPMKKVDSENIPLNAPTDTVLSTKPQDMNPLLALQDVIGCSLNQCSKIFWSKNPKTKELIYTAGSLIIISDLNGKKRFYTSHSKPIVALDLSYKGDLLASADESTIKIWSFATSRCLASWKLDEGFRIKCLGISPDNSYLVSVSKNTHNQDVVVVWDLNTLNKISVYKPQPSIVATQISKTNILSSKFAPPDNFDTSLQFCTCGQENIRFWRIKNGALRSGLVVLDKSIRNTVFTAIGYEGKRRVYVGSKDGNVLQINAESQELEFVYKLHDSGIYSLAVNEGFCATGSDDKYLRVWPLDFSEFFMEAKHEGTVLALDISIDGVMVICGTERGSIGLLDLSQQKYRTLARAHTNDILYLTMNQRTILSISKDKTIRLWNIEDHQQAYEFSSFDDQALCASLCPNKQIFACGFESGCLRIFDIERTSVIGEYRMFDKALVDLKYLKDCLLTLAVDGSIAVHNTSSYDGIKQIMGTSVNSVLSIPINERNGLFASIGKDISIWNIEPLELTKTISMHGMKVQGGYFLDEKNLLVLTSDSCLRTYDMNGTLIHKRQVMGLPSGQCKIIPSANGRYIIFAGIDQTVRINSSPILSYSNDPITLKEYQGHTVQIKTGLFHVGDPTLFLSAGGMEGIFIWHFNGTIIEEHHEVLKTLSIRGDSIIKEETVKGIQIASDLSVPMIIDIEPLIPSLIKVNKRMAKRKELNLPLAHYVSNHEDKQLFYEDLSTRTFTTEDQSIHLQKVIGYNGNSHRNVVYCSEYDWIAFSIGHKLIVEEFTSKRQKVYLEQEAEISTLAISREFLATGTGIPNRTTNIAEIVIYSIHPKPNLVFKKKLAFYQKGVQALQFSKSEPGKLWSVGRYPENTLALWDATTGICLASEVLSEPIHSLCDFDKFNWIYGFSLNHVSLIRIIEGNKLTVDKVIKEKAEYTCAAQIEDVLIIGATNGNLLVYNPVTSEIVKERRVSASEITCIEYNKGVISVTGGDTLYIWRKAISWRAIERRPIEVKLDSIIIALSPKNANELLVGTSSDSLYLVLMLAEEETMAMKLHSNNSEVTALCVSENPKLLISGGTDNTIKFFSKENCDLLMEFNFSSIETRCNALTIINDLVIGCFNDGCVRFWSLRTLKQLGKTRISSSALTAMSTNGLALLIGNEAGAVFVMNFVSLNPLLGNIQKIELAMEGSITSIDYTSSPFIIASTSKGDITMWEMNVDLALHNIPEKCLLIERDRWNIFENPHGVEVSYEDVLIYKEKQRHNVLGMVYKEDPRLSICSCDTLQYLYIRDTVTHSIQRRVIIDIFPMKIIQLPAHNWIGIGGTEGTIKMKNIENLEEENVRLHYSPVQAIEVYPEETNIVTGGKGEIIKWAIELGN